MDYQMLSMGLGFPAPTHTNAVTDEFYPANGQYTVHDSDALVRTVETWLIAVLVWRLEL